jgi:RNA polymerase sigma-70 factor (ECF subfamily)
MHDPQRAFPATHWSLVLRAGQSESPEAADALENLCAIYREPILHYLRHKGFSPSEVEDLVQGFFHSLIRRNSLAHVGPQRGRFRSYLKACLRYFLIDHLRATQPMQEMDWCDLEEAAIAIEDQGQHPANALDRAWAEHVVNLAYQRLAARHESPGDLEWFRLLQPFLAEDPSTGEYARVALALGVSPNTLAKRVQRLREELDHQIRAELLQTVGTPADVEREIRALFT